VRPQEARKLTQDYLFVVVSTTNCHEYYRDELLTYDDLTNIRTAGITITVDGNPEVVGQEEEAEFTEVD
jgi:hypothetical protein